MEITKRLICGWSKVWIFPSRQKWSERDVIQFFEIAFELAWKLMKDYLKDEGFQLNSPREIIKQAFQSNVIRDDHTWFQALEDRELNTQIYEEEIAVEVAGKIEEHYAPLLKQLYLDFKAKMES